MTSRSEEKRLLKDEEKLVPPTIVCNNVFCSMTQVVVSSSSISSYSSCFCFSIRIWLACSNHISNIQIIFSDYPSFMNDREKSRKNSLFVDVLSNIRSFQFVREFCVCFYSGTKFLGNFNIWCLRERERKSFDLRFVLHKLTRICLEKF